MLKDFKLRTEIGSIYEWESKTDLPLSLTMDMQTGYPKDHSRSDNEFIYLHEGEIDNFKYQIEEIYTFGSRDRIYILTVEGSLYEASDIEQTILYSEVKKKIASIIKKFHLNADETYIQKMGLSASIPFPFAPADYFRTWEHTPNDSRSDNHSCLTMTRRNRCQTYKIRLFDKLLHCLPHSILSIEIDFKGIQKFNKVGVVMLIDLMDKQKFKKMKELFFISVREMDVNNGINMF